MRSASAKIKAAYYHYYYCSITTITATITIIISIIFYYYYYYYIIIIIDVSHPLRVSRTRIGHREDRKSTGNGSEVALKLLLNVLRYERQGRRHDSEAKVSRFSRQVSTRRALTSQIS